MTEAQGGVDPATGQRPLHQEIAQLLHARPASDLDILELPLFTQQG